ncbi:MAG: PDZ domain-containing protein [Nocardioides sp.]|uniref:YlbL family protein n=1 Tax=Nocardioides sp. TaxID=35761 RepID=UPI0039E59273
MTQRTLAGLIALPLVIALIAVAWFVPLPFTIYSPGPTVNILGTYDGSPIVTVKGHKIYRDSGELRMTTVSETTREAHLGLWELMAAWIGRDDAIYPHAVAYPSGGTVQSDEEEGAVQMATAQDSAIAAALTELDYHVGTVVSVAAVEKGSPAAGVLKTGDVIKRVDGTAVATADAAVKAVRRADPGDTIRLRIKRDGTIRTVEVTAGTNDGHAYLGVSLGESYTFPFKVSININSAIGGPSAGLMMALSIYDTLTPGSLTDGQHVAGTGTMDADGTVGAIGGIQQKIPGAMHDGAKLFLVPAANCQDVSGADHGSMRLVKVSTLDDALSAITTWTKDHDATLPSCGSNS